MARIARITWQRVQVISSEWYAPIGGEAGNSAEWRLYFDVKINGRSRRHEAWEKEGVRDNNTYALDRQIDVVLDGPLSIEVFGHEKDISSDNDKIPGFVREHTPEPGWETGGVDYRKRAVNGDFSYFVHYRIEYITQGATLTPGAGKLFDPIHSGLWDASSARQYAAFGRTAAQVAAQADEVWKDGGRMAQLQPYMLGGRVLYNVIWTFTNKGQLWNLDCDEAHFRKTTGENWDWARPHSVIPFVLNGQLRYACLWNEGQHAQLWHPNTDETGVRKLTNESWKWARPHQVYAVSINQQVRYSCLWNAGQWGQVWNPNCSETDARQLGDDSWSWGRAHQILPFLHNGARRYSVLWNAGQQGQLWNMNCNLRQVEENTASTASWARPKQIFTLSE